MDGGLAGQIAVATPRRAHDPVSIERWLVERLAAITDQDQSDIDVSQPFSYYAMDSLATVELTADLEDWLDAKLPATLVWDYPSIDALTGYLTRLGSS